MTENDYKSKIDSLILELGQDKMMEVVAACFGGGQISMRYLIETIPAFKPADYGTDKTPAIIL